MPMHVQPQGQQQYPQEFQQLAQRQYPAQYQPQQPRHSAPAAAGLTSAGQFWYYLGCFPAAAMYFAKVPAKKAMQDFGMCEMTAAEKFWYVLMCVSFGAGYFAKLPVAKALSEAPQFRRG